MIVPVGGTARVSPSRHADFLQPAIGGLDQLSSPGLSKAGEDAFLAIHEACCN